MIGTQASKTIFRIRYKSFLVYLGIKNSAIGRIEPKKKQIGQTTHYLIQREKKCQRELQNNASYKETYGLKL